MSQLPRVVVFDMAGTTVYDEDYVNLCLQDTLRAAGVEVTRDDVNSVMGYPKPMAIRLLLERKAPLKIDHSAEAAAVVHDDFLVRMNAFYETEPSLREIEGTTQTFTELRAMGIKVAIDTGFSRTTADIIINRLGWRAADLLDATVTSDEVAQGRPHADMIYRVMELTDVAHASEVAKVGDTPSDLQEGTAAKCGWVVGVTNGSHTEEELRKFPHTHIIAGVKFLPALFGGGQ